jgi:3-methyladenine DNA glycosylase AlkD
MTNNILSSKLKTASSKGPSTTRNLKFGTWNAVLDPILIKLAKSSSLWERRIAILATFAFIRAGRHEEAFVIAESLLHDKHDLIHKAVGWMLREVGKRIGKDPLREFLDKHASTMPRTALRYAIEHLNENERKHYMIFKTV